MTGADAAEPIEPSTARLSAFGSLEGTELDGLAQLAGPERTLARGDVLWEQGRRLPSLFVVLDGWLVSQLNMDDGRDLAVKLHLPGDVLGLPSLAFTRAAETTVALTKVKLRPLALHSFGHLFDAYPRIAAMMFLVSQQERMNLTDRLASTYTANVQQRLAAFLCQLLERVRRSFPETTDSFFMPATRQHVADMIGAGQLQLSQALKQLRTQDLMGWTDRLLTIIDEDGLAAAARLPERTLARDPHWLPASGDDD